MKIVGRKMRRRAPEATALRQVDLCLHWPSPARVTRLDIVQGVLFLLGPFLLAWAISRLPVPAHVEERMEIVWEEPAPPPPEPEPIVPPPEPEQAAPPPPAPRPDPSPPPVEEPPPVEPPPVFGLPEDALSTSGDLAVATGNTLLATPDSVVRPDPGPLPPAPPAPPKPDLDGPYLEALRQEIARHYPARARKFRLEGAVRLRLVIDKTGRILEMSLVQGSGHRVLDQGVLDGLHRLGAFAPFPPGMERERWELEVPVNFRLR